MSTNLNALQDNGAHLLRAELVQLLSILSDRQRCRWRLALRVYGAQRFVRMHPQNPPMQTGGRHFDSCSDAL